MIIKKLFLLFLFFILVPFAFAQEDNFNNYSSLEMSISVRNSIDIDFLKQTSELEFLTAELAIFPRQDERQKILSKEIISMPNSEMEEEGETINFRWQNIKKEKLDYGIEATLLTENDLKKISTRVKFPLETLNEDIMKYTEFSEFIDSNEEIRRTASEIVEGETDLYIATYKLADWVKQNIQYNLTTLTADALQKSTWTFENKQGVCDELTNLFMSMARSVGIPVRFVAGAVYTNVLYDFGNHGWAEVYFPEYGWVPFDVTFGQYGWVDPGHVKMIESVDYGKSNAIFYTWRSKDVDVDPKSLDVVTKVKSKKGYAGKFSDIKIRPVQLEVGFGSKVPIEVTVENTNDFYLPTSLVLTSAPKVIRGKNVFTVLKPRETKKFYWIVEIPEDLDKKFIYTSTLGVKNNLNQFYEGELKYAESYDEYSLGRAERYIERYQEVSEKQPLPDVEFSCKKNKEVYYENEKAIFECEVLNKGNVNLENTRLCLNDECEVFDLRLAEKRNFMFDYKTSSSEKIQISLTSNAFADVKGLDLKVVKIPEVKINYVGKDVFDYKSQEAILLELTSNTLVKDVKLMVNGQEIELDDFTGIYNVNVSVSRKSLKDNLEFELFYKDEIGKEYSSKENKKIGIVNIPLYAKIINFFKNLFN